MKNRGGFLLDRRGSTLIEVAIIILVLGILVAGPKIAGDMISNLFKQQARAQSQLEAQVALYALVRDVRNCRSIVSIAPDKMVLRMFNHHQGYDTNDVQLFSGTNIATVTYQFVNTSTSSYILRLSEYPDKTLRKQIMLNSLSEPTAANYLFRQPDGITLSSPEGVEISFRMSKGFWKSSPKNFETRVMKRTGNASP